MAAPFFSRFCTNHAAPEATPEDEQNEMGCLAPLDNADERNVKIATDAVNNSLFPQVQTFLAVAKTQSFSGAARELGVSRSAVSQSIRQLEEELRVTLVVRTTRSVSLTEPGKRLLEAAGPAMAQVRAALTEAARNRARLSVACA